MCQNKKPVKMDLSQVEEKYKDIEAKYNSRSNLIEKNSNQIESENKSFTEFSKNNSNTSNINNSGSNMSNLNKGTSQNNISSSNTGNLNTGSSSQNSNSSGTGPSANIKFGMDPKTGEINNLKVDVKVTPQEAKEIYNNNKHLLPSKDQVIEGAKTVNNVVQNSSTTTKKDPLQSIFGVKK